ncbi:hypothetical protein BHE74_00031516 [Ensete ventricosum]|nr:hypothetical protein BHE74_00031516 [Ensete ventricosum]
MTRMKLDNKGVAIGKQGKGRSVGWEGAPRVTVGREVLVVGSGEKSDRLVQISDRGRGALDKGGRGGPAAIAEEKEVALFLLYCERRRPPIKDCFHCTDGGRGEGGREGVALAVVAGVIKKRLLLDEVNDCKPDSRGCGLVTMPRKQEDGSKQWVSVGGGVPSSRRNQKQHEQMVAAVEGEAEEATTSAFGVAEAMIEDKSIANNERKASVVLQRSCPREVPLGGVLIP